MSNRYQSTDTRQHTHLYHFTSVYLFVACILLLLTGSLVKGEPIADVAPPTSITAKTMEYDMDASLARLTGEVEVIDGDMTLRADFVIAKFDKENTLIAIEATGKVTIIRGTDIATSGKADYIVATETVTLSDKPVLQTGPNRIRGAERVIFDRTKSKFSTDGGTPIMEFFNTAGQKLSLGKKDDN